MRRPRFTIAGILGFVVLLAVGLAALREATDAWDSAVFGATVCALTCSALLAVHRRARRRAFSRGFALFGWVYLAASLVPSVGARLPTTRGLVYLVSKLADRSLTPASGNAVLATTNNGDFIQLPDGRLVLAVESIRFWNPATGKSLSLVRGTAENFVRIGHSLAALVVGLLGGPLSGRLYEAHDADGDE